MTWDSWKLMAHLLLSMKMLNVTVLGKKTYTTIWNHTLSNWLSIPICENKTFNHFCRGKVKHSFIGMSSDIGKDLEIPYKPTLASPVTINIKLPTLFRRGSASDDEIERIHKFLVKGWVVVRCKFVKSWFWQLNFQIEVALLFPRQFVLLTE